MEQVGKDINHKTVYISLLKLPEGRSPCDALGMATDHFNDNANDCGHDPDHDNDNDNNNDNDNVNFNDHYNDSE